MTNIEHVLFGMVSSAVLGAVVAVHMINYKLKDIREELRKLNEKD